MTDFETPMGNTELRLSLASIESEVAEVKSISMENNEHAKYTNGKIMWLTKLAWLTLGALPLLTVWSVWLTSETLKSREELSPVQTQAIQAAVLAGILEATKQYAK